MIVSPLVHYNYVRVYLSKLTLVKWPKLSLLVTLSPCVCFCLFVCLFFMGLICIFIYLFIYLFISLIYYY